ncbi:putative transcriptional regulator, XRE family [Stanieria sp. NIES-3757]|nr:putative transcriptional regulator, XRE family [Stanieria sp. NIES-3757]
MIRNNLKALMDAQKITRYRFWKDTRVNRDTAYRLYNDPNYIPGAEVMDKIAETYGWLPGAYLYYLPNTSQSTQISA